MRSFHEGHEPGGCLPGSSRGFIASAAPSCLRAKWSLVRIPYGSRSLKWLHGARQIAAQYCARRRKPIPIFSFAATRYPGSSLRALVYPTSTFACRQPGPSCRSSVPKARGLGMIKYVEKVRKVLKQKWSDKARLFQECLAVKSGHLARDLQVVVARLKLLDLVKHPHKQGFRFFPSPA